MANSYFQFKQFRINQVKTGMKVTTDACLFGAWVSDQIKRSEEPKRILDIGTGTGLLALMLAQATNSASIEAIEINEDAFGEAKANFQDSPWSGRMTIHHQSLQAIKAKDSFDLIICNPPFFKNSLKGSEKNKNQAIHNDQLSTLDLAKGIAHLMSKKGDAYIMYPPWEMDQFQEEMKEKGIQTQQRLMVKDHGKSNTLRVFAKFSYQKESIQKIEHIIIKSDKASYSNQFSTLLAPYYLNINR